MYKFIQDKSFLKKPDSTEEIEPYRISILPIEVRFKILSFLPPLKLIDLQLDNKTYWEIKRIYDPKPWNPLINWSLLLNTFEYMEINGCLYVYDLTDLKRHCRLSRYCEGFVGKLIVKNYYPFKGYFKAELESHFQKIDLKFVPDYWSSTKTIPPFKNHPSANRFYKIYALLAKENYKFVNRALIKDYENHLSDLETVDEWKLIPCQVVTSVYEEIYKECLFKADRTYYVQPFVMFSNKFLNVETDDLEFIDKTYRSSEFITWKIIKDKKPIGIAVFCQVRKNCLTFKTS
ncbi:hypothetical protein KM759_gp010 [Lymphocystis disease virus 4]|uniref:F-box domain-containing protein n=1 Tax=Lymphocystis disease virus 4 TaxID=2704413 RepID=A0A6B9XMH7_9VIRU|nr:hypothetical protein KM759_gp010 [Lymphocystis disease virus 4]QHR78493.1 hypothetical protein [Lymphocystis disease virus 4]